jgi:hypothetical protein
MGRALMGRDQTARRRTAAPAASDPSVRVRVVARVAPAASAAPAARVAPATAPRARVASGPVALGPAASGPMDLARTDLARAASDRTARDSMLRARTSPVAPPEAGAALRSLRGESGSRMAPGLHDRQVPGVAPAASDPAPADLARAASQVRVQATALAPASRPAVRSARDPE